LNCTNKLSLTKAQQFFELNANSGRLTADNINNNNFSFLSLLHKSIEFFSSSSLLLINKQRKPINLQQLTIDN